MSTIINKAYFTLAGTYQTDISQLYKVSGGSNLTSQIQAIAPFASDYRCEFTVTNQWGKNVGWFTAPYLETETISSGAYSGDTWNVWYFDVLQSILSEVSRVSATKLYFQFRWKEIDNTYVASLTSAYEFDSIGYETNISNEIIADYGVGTSGEWYLVTDTLGVTRSFQSNGVSWSDLEYEKPIYPNIYPSDVVEIPLTPTIVSTENTLSNAEMVIITSWLTILSSDVSGIQTALETYSEDGAFDGTDDTVYSTDYRIAQHLQGFLDKTTYLADIEEVLGWTNQDVQTTSSPTFVQVNVDSVDYNDGSTGGQNSWNNIEQCIDTVINSNVTLQNGREILKLGRNSSGATITDLKPVALIGSIGQTARIELVDETDQTQSLNTIGVTTEDIANNSTGNITTKGRVRGDFSAYSDGDKVYVSGSALSTTAPTKDGTNRVIYIGTVEKADVSGILYVDPIILHFIDELSDVVATSVTTGDILKYDGSKWVNVSFDTEIAETVKSVTLNPTTFVLTFTHWNDTTTEIDLPTESSIVDISYDNTTKDLTFTLRSGATTAVPLDDIITGLATETFVTTAITTLDNDLQGQINTINNTSLPSKVDEVLGYSEVAYGAVPDNDTAYVYLDMNGVQRKINLTNLYTGANTATSAFLANGDYSSNGLKANEAAFIPLHQFTSNATNQYQVYISIMALSDKQIVYGKMPTITSTSYLQLSTAGDTGYINVVTENGMQIPANVVSDAKVMFYYDATNTRIVLFDFNELSNTTVSYTESIGAFKTPENGVDIAIGKKTVSQADDARGLTYEQVVSNGDFSDGTTGWNGQFGTLSVASGIATNTADGTQAYSRIYKTMSIAESSNTYFKARVRVTNSSASDFRIRAYDGSTFSDVVVQATPTINQWYEISGVFTGDVTIVYIQQDYADSATASGKVMEVDYIMAIPVPTALSSKTADELAQIFPRYISQGLHRWGESGTYTPSNYSSKMQEAIEAQGYASGDTINGIWINTTGNNLFDKSQVTQNEYISTTVGTALYHATYCSSEYISVKPNTVYYGSSTQQGAFYDANKKYISGFSTQSITTPVDAVYLRTSFDYSNVDTFQLNIGTTALDYTPYEDNTLWIDTNGINDIGGVYDDLDTQRIKEYTLQESDIFAYSSSTINIDVIVLLKPLDFIYYGSADTGSTTRMLSMYFPNFTSNSYADNVDREYSIYDNANTQYGLIVPKGTYVSLAEAKADLVGTVVYYQLATPLPRTLENNNLIPQHGALTITPYGQYTVSDVNGVAWKFFATSALNNEAQAEQDRINDVIQAKQIRELDSRLTVEESNIDALNIGQQEDLRFPATLIRQGLTSKPDFDITNVVLLFPQNDTTEIAYINAQMPHSWLAGSTIYPHVHIIQEANQQAVFKMDYRWFSLGDTVPASWTTYTMNTYTSTYTSGSIHQLLYGSSGISGTGMTESSVLQIKLYRDDNVYTGDVKMIEFDIHYYVEKLGKDI